MILSPRFELALALAVRLHATQTRKGTRIPYVSHLLAVAGAALEYGADEDQAIAALLHDAVEDVGEDARDQINRCFGARVTRIVDRCSDAAGPAKAAWGVRKMAYLAHLADADADVLLVSAADKLHNARSLVADLRSPLVDNEAFWGRFNASKEQTVWYYTSLLAAYERSGRVHKGLLAELGATTQALAAAVGGDQPAPYPAPPPGWSPNAGVPVTS